MANRSTEFPHLALTDRGYILGMGLGQIYVTPDIGLAMRLSDQGFASMEKAGAVPQGIGQQRGYSVRSSRYV